LHKLGIEAHYTPLFCFALNKSDLSSLDFVINRLFMKLFETNNIEIVELCQYQFQSINQTVWF